MICNTANALNVLAASISCGGRGAPSNDQVVDILFGLASDAETGSALVFLCSEASFLARELETKSTGNKKTPILNF